MVRGLLLQTLGGIFSSGVSTVTGGVQKEFASGGIVTSPTRALIGEAGPEVVLPLTRDPASGMMGVISRGGGGMSPVVNISIANSAPSSPENDKRMAATAAREMSKAMRDVMRNALMDESRPGGVLNRL
jgi:phage-related minor tail protein